MTSALAASPLSSSYVAAFEQSVGVQPRYLYLAELRRLPLLQMARVLRGLRGGPVYLLLEDESSLAALPILKAVASLSSSTSVTAVGPELRRQHVTRTEAARGLAALLAASMRGQLALRACRREVDELLATERTEQRLRPSNDVLYLNGNLWLGLKAGGSVGHVAGVVNGFAALGRDVHLASVVDPILVSSSVHAHALTPPDTLGLPLETNYHRFTRSMVRQVSQLDALRETAFVYQRLSLGNYAGAVLARRENIPFVLEYNGSEVWVARHWGRRLRYEKLAEDAEAVCLRHATVVVTVSEILRAEVESRGVAPHRIACYPNGVDTTLFDPHRWSDVERRAHRQEMGIDPEALVATFVGTFGQWHGVERLAKAIRVLAGDEQWLTTSRLHFLLVGDGMRMAETRRILAEVPPHVYTLTGLVPQAEAPRHLFASDILLSPHVPNSDGSPFFGSPTKLFEYMAMGKPIIASALDQIADVLDPGLDVNALPADDEPFGRPELAIMTRPGSANDLAIALRFLTERPRWRGRLGENARVRALERHTWHHHVQAIVERLDALAAR
jgi:glycosyltransferase involved in cell wall biosynthesis